MKKDLTFEERYKLGMKHLSNQSPVSIETALNQVKVLKGFLTFEQFLNESKTYTAKEIVDYITEISDTPETDVPDYYFKIILKDKSKFIKDTLQIKDLLNKDKSLAEYVKSGEDRYEDSEYEPSYDELYNPIVVHKGEVIDGYNRISTLYKNGEKQVEAYIST